MSAPFTVVDLMAPGAADAHFREQQLPVEAIPTPFPSWNCSCRDDGGGVGLARGWHVTVAANTGQGKSLLALNSAARAIELGFIVAFLSLEMSMSQVANRLYSILTGASIRGLERGSFSAPVAGNVSRELAAIRERTGGQFFVNRTPLFTSAAVHQMMIHLLELHGASLFITDYLQLAAARDSDKLFSTVSDVSAQLREFAKTHNVVSLALSQFNRTTSANYSERPTIQGLMGASSIENDSDQVLLLDHTRSETKGDRRTTWALLGKNRHGRVGEFPIEWDYSSLRVREVTQP